MESSINTTVKDDSDDNQSQSAFLARENLYSTTATAAYADVTLPSIREQSQPPGSPAETLVGPRRGSHHGPIKGQATTPVGLDTIRDDSASIPEGFDSHLLKKQSSGSITSEEPSPNNLMTLSLGDDIYGRKVAGRSPKRSRTEL
ncbi:hypothetical protein F66182_18153, partial [Fusarium sp. NRRL 66182]